METEKEREWQLSGADRQTPRVRKTHIAPWAVGGLIYQVTK